MALNWAQRRYFLNLTGASAEYAVAFGPCLISTLSRWSAKMIEIFFTCNCCNCPWVPLRWKRRYFTDAPYPRRGADFSLIDANCWAIASWHQLHLFIPTRCLGAGLFLQGRKKETKLLQITVTNHSGKICERALRKDQMKHWKVFGQTFAAWQHENFCVSRCCLVIEAREIKHDRHDNRSTPYAVIGLARMEAIWVRFHFHYVQLV